MSINCSSVGVSFALISCFPIVLCHRGIHNGEGTRD